VDVVAPKHLNANWQSHTGVAGKLWSSQLSSNDRCKLELNARTLNSPKNSHPSGQEEVRDDELLPY